MILSQLKRIGPCAEVVSNGIILKGLKSTKLLGHISKVLNIDSLL